MPTATFDGENLRVVIPSVGSYNAQTDIYSDWKVWFKTGNNSRYVRAFDTTGGDETVSPETLSNVFFLRNDLGWRLQPPEADGEVRISGDLYGRDEANFPLVVPTTGAFTVAWIFDRSAKARNIVTAGGGDPATVAAAVWDKATADHSASGSFGEFVQEKLLQWRQYWVGQRTGRR